MMRAARERPQSSPGATGKACLLPSNTARLTQRARPPPGAEGFEQKLYAGGCRRSILLSTGHWCGAGGRRMGGRWGGTQRHAAACSAADAGQAGRGCAGGGGRVEGQAGGKAAAAGRQAAGGARGEAGGQAGEGRGGGRCGCGGGGAEGAHEGCAALGFLSRVPIHHRAQLHAVVTNLHAAALVHAWQEGGRSGIGEMHSAQRGGGRMWDSSSQPRPPG